MLSYETFIYLKLKLIVLFEYFVHAQGILAVVKNLLSIFLGFRQLRIYLSP